MDCGCSLVKKKKKISMDFKKIALKTVTKMVVVGSTTIGARALSFKVMPNMDKLWKGIGFIGIGAFAPALMDKSDRESMAKDAGAGFIAAGSLELAEKFFPTIVGAPAVSGIGATAYALGDEPTVNGPYDINGTDDHLGGTDEQVSSPYL